MKRRLVNFALFVLMLAAVAVWVRLPWPAILAAAVVFALWMAFARGGRQAAAVTRVGISTLGQRIGSSSVIVLGIAGVVGVLVAMLAMGTGLRATLQSGGDQESAIVTRGGAPTESQSVLVRDDLDAIAQAPGVARDAEGRPLISGEIVIAFNARQRDSENEGTVQMRGVDEMAFAVRPGLKLVEGRMFRSGLNELVVGRDAAARYENFGIGDTVRIGPEQWTVVGVFASGSGYDSEAWADRTIIASSNRRGSSVSAALVQLVDADAFSGFEAALTSDPKLNVRVQTTADYLAAQSEGIATLTRVVGIVVGVIMAIGAIFGALNCMFAAVASRAREIATLRAIGFRGTPVVVSVMLETMVLALLGGLLGAFIVWFFFNGHSAATLNGFSQVVFRFKVDWPLVANGLKWALAIGFIGGLFPAARAARLPVTTALRES